jgi:hypothetical protein
MKANLLLCVLLSLSLVSCALTKESEGGIKLDLKKEVQEVFTIKNQGKLESHPIYKPLQKMYRADREENFTLKVLDEYPYYYTYLVVFNIIRKNDDKIFKKFIDGKASDYEKYFEEFTAKHGAIDEKAIEKQIQEVYQAEPAEKIIYQAIWNGTNVVGNIYINNILISEGSQTAGTAPLNIWLAGENQIRLELSKAEAADSADFSLGVSKLKIGEIADTSGKGNLINLTISNKEFEESKTVRASQKFSSALDFSRHLMPIAGVKEKEVVEYAAKIYGFFEKKDIKNILNEFSVKIQDYSIAFYNANMKNEFESYLKNEVFKGKLEKVNPADIKAEKVSADSNLWHVYDKNKELLRSSYADGSTAEMAVYVGVIDGKLKVIR